MSATAREFAKPEVSGAAVSAEAPGFAPEAPGATKAPALPRKIIYKAEVELISAKLDETARQIEAKVKELGGYVSGEKRERCLGREPLRLVDDPHSRREVRRVSRRASGRRGASEQ